MHQNNEACSKLFSYFQPTFRCSWCRLVLFFKVVDNGLAHLWDKDTAGAGGNSESIGQALKGISSCQKSKRDSQLETGAYSFSAVGVFLGYLNFYSLKDHVELKMEEQQW